MQSLAVCVNPGSAFNSYWPMPFRKHAKITMENLDDRDMVVYYQIDYSQTEVPKDAAYFHAQFRRVNLLPYKNVYTILDGVKGKEQYVGTYLAYGVHNDGWWGEGEINQVLPGRRQGLSDHQRGRDGRLFLRFLQFRKSGEEPVRGVHLAI
jgi:hypothetical protein